MGKFITMMLCLFVLSSQAQTVITGRVESRQQFLQGAVIKINGTQERAVTGSAGMFAIVVPDSLMSGTITASYAGYADEQRAFRVDTLNVVRLLQETPVKVSRKYQPKMYMRTAHKQIRKQLRKIR